MKILKESDFNDYQDYFYEYDEVLHDILMKMINNDLTPIKLTKIKPQMYQQALNEFMRYGKLMRYPTKYIDAWKDIIIRNTILLNVITDFYGHTQHGVDIDKFNEYVFNPDETGEEGVSDWHEMMEYIEQQGWDDRLETFMPKFSNGHDLISDYGLEPLQRITQKLMETDDPNQTLVLINKALDISHQRSDLSELFIEGGAASLDKISGVNEAVSRIINETIFEFFYE
jgi:hypothetical protein